MKRTETLVKRLKQLGMLINKGFNPKPDGSHSTRFYGWIDEYADIQEQLRARGVWEQVCATQGWAVSHDGWDCAA